MATMRLHKEVREVVDKAGEIGWKFTGNLDGKGHPVLVHENGSQYSIPGTPGDWRSLKNSMSALENLAGQKIDRGGKRRASHRKFEGSGFSIEDAKREQAEFHRNTDVLPIADLWTQRRNLIARMVELIHAGGDNVDLAAASLWKIRATERALKNFGQSVREFDLMDLPIDAKTKESVKSKVHAAPKPDPTPARLAEKAAAGKAPRKRRAKKDNFDGTLLLAETEPWRVQLLGKTYDLYLSPENRSMIEEFLTNLTDGATIVRKTRKRKVTPELTHQRKVEAAKAGPAAPEGHSSALIRAWLKTHGWPDIPDRGRFSREQLVAYACRNKKARRLYERGLADLPKAALEEAIVRPDPTETAIKRAATKPAKPAMQRAAQAGKPHPLKGRNTGPTTPAGEDSKVIRQWLRHNGWPDVGDRGRFSKAQLAAWSSRNLAKSA